MFGFLYTWFLVLVCLWISWRKTQTLPNLRLPIGSVNVLPCLVSLWCGVATTPSTELAAAALLGRVGSRQAVLLLTRDKRDHSRFTHWQSQSLNFADILVVVQLIRRQMRTNNSWTTIRKSWDFWQWLLIDHKYFIYYHMLLIYDWSRSIDHWLSFISWPARVVQVAHVAPDPPAVVEQPQGVHVLQGAAVVAAAAVVRHSTCEAIVRSGYFGCNTGNGKKLSSSQVQLGQATCLAVA